MQLTTCLATKSLVRACAAYGIAAYDKTDPNKVVKREWSRDTTAEWLSGANRDS
jgi:hypothetical protein